MTDAQIQTEVERQLAIMRDGAVDFHGEADLARRLAARLKEGRPLRVKFGADPSSPDLHLGHSVVLMKLRRFQDRAVTSRPYTREITGLVSRLAAELGTEALADRPLFQPGKGDATAVMVVNSSRGLDAYAFAHSPLSLHVRGVLLDPADLEAV